MNSSQHHCNSITGISKLNAEPCIKIFLWKSEFDKNSILQFYGLRCNKNQYLGVKSRQIQASENILILTVRTIGH